MKLKKTASGKNTLDISRKEWLNIGKTAKWIDKSKLNKRAFEEEEWGDITQYESMGEAHRLFDDIDIDEKRERLITKIKRGELSEDQIDRILEEEGIDLDELEGIDLDDESAALAAQEEIAREQEKEELDRQREESLRDVDPDEIRREYIDESSRDKVRLDDLRN